MDDWNTSDPSRMISSPAGISHLGGPAGMGIRFCQPLDLGTLDRPSGTERLSGTDRHSGTDRPSIISSGTSNRSGGGGGGVNGLGVAKAGSVGSLGRAKSAAASASAKTIKTRCKVMMAPVKRLCSFIAEHKAYVFVGTFITVWALLGDDLKLLTTDKPADGLFDGLVVFCI
ncbi:unnamed protein product, partial [Effrenium voratum]